VGCDKKQVRIVDKYLTNRTTEIVKRKEAINSIGIYNHEIHSVMKRV